MQAPHAAHDRHTDATEQLAAEGQALMRMEAAALADPESALYQEYTSRLKAHIAALRAYFESPDSSLTGRRSR